MRGCKNCHYYGKLTGSYGCTLTRCKRKSWNGDDWTDKDNKSISAKARRCWSHFGSWLGFWY